MHIAYILYKNEDGYLNETKFMQEMENPPLQGTKVKTFYDEEVIFENVAGLSNGEKSNYSAENGKFISISESEVKERIIKNLQERYLLLENSGSINMSYEDDLFGSCLGQLRSYFFNNDIPIPEKNESIIFSEDKYRENDNQLSVLCSFQNSGFETVADIITLKKMQNATNTMLIEEGILNNISNINNIPCCKHTSDDSSIENINYSEASSIMRDIATYHNRKPKTSRFGF